MLSGRIKKLLLLIIIFIIGIGVFLFGSPHLNSYLNEKDDIINTINLKLQIVESIQSSERSAMQQSAQVTMNKYDLTRQELCKSQYFYLKRDCELTQLNKTNLKKINAMLEVGIQEIIKLQNDVLE